MANLRLKKTILEVVDNQLKANDPPCTKETYQKLLDAGYSVSEAKDKIGAVVLSEIYDILKEGQKFDEENYQKCLQEMLEQCIDLESDAHIETEWDRWDAFMQRGYGCFGSEKETEGLQAWQEAWQLLCSIIEQIPEKKSVSEWMEEQDYVYPIDGWLQDYEMELGNAGKNEDRMAYCQKVLDLFDWQEDDNYSCFRCGIAESLFAEKKIQESFDYYEQWLAEEPDNFNGIESYSWTLFANGDYEKSYEVVRNVTWGVPCDMDNSILFMNAKRLADHVGKTEESQWYQEQIDKFEASWKNMGNRQTAKFDGYTVPSQLPVVKPQKIYPNDPCPCGSGKKYKKCCGKR